MDSQEQHLRIMVGRNRSLDKIPKQVAGMSLNLEGEATSTDDVVGLVENLDGGGSSRSNSLAKSEC